MMISERGSPSYSTLRLIALWVYQNQNTLLGALLELMQHRTVKKKNSHCQTDSTKRVKYFMIQVSGVGMEIIGEIRGGYCVITRCTITFTTH